MNTLHRQLFALADESYKTFHVRLMPTISPDLIIGIRTPVLRKFAGDFGKIPESVLFLEALPHTYYEENNLHAFLIEKISDFDRALSETERFLPYIDNWATCDSFLPKVFRKNRDRLLPKINEWLKSDAPYTLRYAIGLLLKLFLEEAFSPDYLAQVAAIRSEEYYVNMMIAWYFATALAKQPAATLPFLTEKRLPVWIHNKAIQKAVESYRVPPETKAILKTLRVHA